jgi:outer membrane protein TolC
MTLHLAAALARPRSGRFGVAVLLMALLAISTPGHGQLSLTSAVDLALRANPRVKMAQDDLAKATAQLAEAQDAYIPSLSAGANVGQAYGYSPYPPTLFAVTSGSLIYNPAQAYYIRSARAGVNAAQFALQDAREAVAEDTALAWIALDHDQKREAVIRQQHEYATKLAQIVQERFDAGQDTAIGLTQAKLSAAELRLAVKQAEDTTALDRDHLARLIDRPAVSVGVADTFPANPVPTSPPTEPTATQYANPGIASAFASAQAKQEEATGEARFRYRPQINLFLQYNRYATFTNSFLQLKESNQAITANEAAIGVQITIPFIDKSRQAKARESTADANHALHEAQNSQIQALDAQAKLRRSLDELHDQAGVASLKQQLAQQQLEIVRLQLQAASPDGPQTTPKDEQNALISERDKYLAVIDADFQLHQAEIQLLRNTGQLDAWLRSAVALKP